MIHVGTHTMIHPCLIRSKNPDSTPLQQAHSAVVIPSSIYFQFKGIWKKEEDRKWKSAELILPSSWGSKVATDPNAGKQQNARRNRKTTSRPCITIFAQLHWKDALKCIMISWSSLPSFLACSGSRSRFFFSCAF